MTTLSLTLAMTGMDPDTETALKAAFDAANGRLDPAWRLVAEADAEYVIVDMDSMYGPMSWLRLHALGKSVIGLTTAPRTQTHFRLGRPFDSDRIAALLIAVAANQGVTMSRITPAQAEAAHAASESTAGDRPAAPPSQPLVADATRIAGSIEASAIASSASTESATTIADPAPPEPYVAAPPSGFTHAPAPQDALPAEQPVTIDASAADTAEPETPDWPWPQSSLLDWLAPGALSQRARYRRGEGPALLIDPAARVYHGPAMLKPLAVYFDGMVRSEDFERVDDAIWARDGALAGPAQPLSRLQWLGGLLAGKGTLLPSHGLQTRFQLGKWPQTEREYPRHFRIATAMMKGPATAQEIATISAMPIGDVVDFINANLTTGYASAVPEPMTEPVETPKPGGLFGRLRGRS